MKTFLKILRRKIIGFMKYNRFLPLFIPLISLILSEFYFFNNKLIYVVLVVVLLLLFFAIRQFVLAGNSSEKWYNFYISPALLFSSLIFFTTLIVGKWLVQIALISATVLMHLYLKMLYIYLVNFNLAGIS